MSIFRKPERRAITADDLVAAARGLRSGQGVVGVLDEDTALRHVTVWACMRLISESLSSMPLVAIRNGEELSPKPALLSSPSNVLSRSTWMEQLAMSLLTGNFVGQVVEERNGWPAKVEIVNPSIVRMDVRGGRMTFEWDGQTHTRWPDGDVVHVPALTIPGSPFGLSPLKYAAVAIQQGLAAEAFGVDFFVSGAIPTGVLENDAVVDQEQARIIKDRYMAAMSGRREPLVLGAGTTYKQITVNPEDSQFIDVQRWSSESVCRAFRVPPEMLSLGSSGSSLTYTNRVDRNADFLTYTLSPWINKIEEALSALLPNGTVVRMRTGGLLRADIRTRYEVYKMAADIQSATGSPVLTVDEMRALEDLPPL